MAVFRSAIHRWLGHWGARKVQMRVVRNPTQAHTVNTSEPSQKGRDFAFTRSFERRRRVKTGQTVTPGQSGIRQPQFPTHATGRAFRAIKSGLPGGEGGATVDVYAWDEGARGAGEGIAARYVEVWAGPELRNNLLSHQIHSIIHHPPTQSAKTAAA